MKWISAILIISGTVKPSAKLMNNKVTSNTTVIVVTTSNLITVKAL